MQHVMLVNGVSSAVKGVQRGKGADVRAYVKLFFGRNL
jgi:hypothetical protein